MSMPGGGGVGNPAGSGGGRLRVFYPSFLSPILIVQILYPPPDFIYTNFSRGRALHFVHTNVSRGQALNFLYTNIRGLSIEKKIRKIRKISKLFRAAHAWGRC